MADINIADVPSTHSLRNKILRTLWGLTWLLLFLPSPRLFHAWRRFLLGIFGAKLGKGVHVYPTAKVWAPWNLEMGEHSCLADYVICYCVNRVFIGSHSTVSQYSYLCTASHDYEVSSMPLTTAPIVIGRGAWVAADVFIGPGVTIGEGSVIGVRSTVIKSIDPWKVAAGSPCRPIKDRIIKN